MQNVHFTTNDIAKLFRVNVSTVKRWIDRGLLPSAVTPGGHRRVTQEQLDHFVKNNERIAPSSYTIRRMRSGRNMQEKSWHSFYALLLQGKPETSRRFFFERYLRTLDVAHLLEYMVAPALRHIGEEWSRHKISVYQEHQMSFLVRLLLIELSSTIPEPPKKSMVAILACVEGDRHEIPLQMASLVLKTRGIRTLVLGANTPAAEIIRAAEDYNATYLLLTRLYSETYSFNYLKTLGKYAQVNNRILLYGGSGWDTRKTLPSPDPWMRYIPSLTELDRILQLSLPKRTALRQSAAI